MLDIATCRFQYKNIHEIEWDPVPTKGALNKTVVKNIWGFVFAHVGSLVTMLVIHAFVGAPVGYVGPEEGRNQVLQVNLEQDWVRQQNNRGGQIDSL